MQDRVTELTERKNAIDQRIEDYLASNEDERTDVEEKMTTQCRVIKEGFERNTLMKIRKADEDEKMITFEYLLKVSDNSNSLNYRGKGPKDRWKSGRRGQGGRQRGF